MPRYRDCVKYERACLLYIVYARQYYMDLGGCDRGGDKFSERRISNGTRTTFFASRYLTKLYST